MLKYLTMKLENKIIGTLFESGGELFIINDTGVHKIVVAPEGREMPFSVSSWLENKSVSVMWPTGSGEMEIWDEGLWEDLCYDMMSEGTPENELDKAKIETFSSILLG